MKSSLKIKFQGVEYLLVGDMDDGGAIYTEEQYSSGNRSYAHLSRYDGLIRRFHEVIGGKKDIEVLQRD